MFAEMVATCAISAGVLIGFDIFLSSAVTACTARSMPRFRNMGLAPEATWRRPRCRIACVSTVAVVVPSPETSCVFVATSLAICAPMFS